jgi:RiboL-PSP-HEPN
VQRRFSLKNEVLEEISIANEWRDGEFAKFKVNPDSVEDSLWSRMCVPMIYAHWEGFTVSALKILINHLNELNLTPNQLSTKLVVVSLSDAYKPLSGKQSFIQRVEFTDKFNKLLCSSVKFNKKINTKSNLKSNVLEEICLMYDFNYENFSEVNSEIDRLVNIRNSIAHGENNIIPNKENICKYIDSVKLAMDILTNEIGDFIEKKKYRLTIS